MINTTTIIDDIGVDNWETFLKTHPSGNFFQSSKYYYALTKVKNNKPFVLFATQNNKIVGLLLAVVQQEPMGIFSFFSSRAIINGGPLVINNDPVITNILLQKLNEHLKSKAIYTQIRNTFDNSSLIATYRTNKYNYEEHLNIIVDLTKNEEELWNDVHTKRRNEIKRSTKEGTYFESDADNDVIDKTYPILQEVYKRAKLPLPSVSTFKDFYNFLGPSVFRIFTANYEGKVIGTMYTLCYNDIIYDWYAGSYKAFYKKYPNDLIPWKIFLWGKLNGYLKFDFGGAGNPNIPYGVRDYKEKFGGTFVNFGRFEKINKPLIYIVSKFGFRMFQILKYKK